jgi:hypothetical protein
MLFIMDALGHWSLLDAFVLVLMMNIFKLPVDLQPLFGFPVLQVDLVTIPQLSIYAFMVSACVKCVREGEANACASESDCN